MSQGVLLTFARRLREARERVGLTQFELGVAAGLDPAVASPRMNQYERGVHEPNIDTVKKLAEALGIPPALLYTDDDHLADLLLVWSQMSLAKRRRLLKLAKAEQGESRSKKKAVNPGKDQF